MKLRACVCMILLTCLLPASAQQTGPTAICEAAASGDLKAVGRWLKQDAKLAGAVNSEGDSVLHLAAGCRRGEEAAFPIVRLLLDNGASLDARNASRQTPLLYAAYAGFPRVVELLVSRGAVVQYKDTNGRSPIHYAAREGHPEVVEFLIGKGADLSLPDNQGRTPLEYAVLRNRIPVVETLLKSGRYDTKGPDGSMILHFAASQGRAELVKSLLDRGADPTRPSLDGEPILLSYLRGGLTALAVETIAKGADIKALDAAGRTALHLAAEKGQDEAVSALLEKGVDPNAVDKSGLSALDLARDWGFRSTAFLLTAKGARPGRSKAYVLKGGTYEFTDLPVETGTEEAVIRYIGNDGFSIEAGSKTVLVDGLVRNTWGYSNTPERALILMKARQSPFERLDLVLFSHAHLDHFESHLALEVLASQPEAVLAGDSLVSEELRKAGPDAVKTLGSRVMTIDVKIGERKSLAANGIPLTVLGVNHSDREPPYKTLGYIMDLGKFRIYHQGDIYPDANMALLSSIPWESLKIDIAFFDPFFLQNEAARRIVTERIRPSAVILMHMREDEGERYLTELRPVVPQVLLPGRVMEGRRFAKVGR
jgi:ankyrin repeat protein/L-ascorbate metabolism protein UlaG (beta-lactamase superfamily)